MAKQLEVYKCAVCGNIVEVLHGGVGTLVCCNQDMKLMVEGEVDAATEKHVPVMAQGSGEVTVKVGEVPHPMGEDHYIEWIEVLADGVVYRKFLKPNDAPEAVFKIEAKNLTAREYCNLHGLWKG